MAIGITKRPHISQMNFVIHLILLLPIRTTLQAGEKRQHSWDLNEPASFGGITGSEKREEEVQSAVTRKLSSPVSHSLSISDRSVVPSWGKKRRREARQPRAEPVIFKQPKILKLNKMNSDDSDFNPKSDLLKKGRRRFNRPRPYVRGNNISGLTPSGECETHTTNCKHWNKLPYKIRKLHSARISKRKYNQSEKGKEEARSRFKRWYNSFSEKERKLINKNSSDRKLYRNQLLPKEVQDQKKARHAEVNRLYRQRKKAERQKQNVE